VDWYTYPDTGVSFGMPCLAMGRTELEIDLSTGREGFTEDESYGDFPVW